MEGIESKSQSPRQDSQITSEISVNLAENVEGFRQCVKEILNLIEQDGEFSEMTAEIYEHKKSKLKKQVAELSRMHGVLADQHVNLIGEFSKNSILTKTQHLDASDSSSPQVTQMFTTPDQMSNTHKFRTPIGFDVYSNVSRVEGSESSFSLSSDSDSESFMSTNKLLISPLNEDAPKTKETKGSESLLKKISNLEEEVVSLTTKIQTLSDENSNLKLKIHENESLNTTQNANVETEKVKVVDLQKQVVDLNIVIETINEELKASKERLLSAENEMFEQTHWLQGQLQSTQQEIAILQRQLDTEKNKVIVLQEEISLFIVDISLRDDQISELNTKLNQSESEISSLKTTLKDKENSFNTDINILKTEITEKNQLVENLNKNMDALKHKYDVLMTEKDGLNAQLDTIRAEMCHRENLLKEAEKRLDSVQIEHAGVVSSFHNGEKVKKELEVKVVELEKEVDRQKEVILDRGEEKREAIRQLSFSLEHYMSGYKELRQAFVGNKRRALVSA